MDAVKLEGARHDNCSAITCCCPVASSAGRVFQMLRHAVGPTVTAPQMVQLAGGSLHAVCLQAVDPHASRACAPLWMPGLRSWATPASCHRSVTKRWKGHRCSGCNQCTLCCPLHSCAPSCSAAAAAAVHFWPTTCKMCGTGMLTPNIGQMQAVCLCRRSVCWGVSGRRRSPPPPHCRCCATQRSVFSHSQRDLQLWNTKKCCYGQAGLQCQASCTTLACGAVWVLLAACCSKCFSVPATFAHAAHQALQWQQSLSAAAALLWLQT